MWSCSGALVLISLVLNTESMTRDEGCGMEPVPGFNPAGIAGNWYAIKIKNPSTFQGRTPATDVAMILDYDRRTRGFIMTVRGRNTIFPYGCYLEEVHLTEKRPGVYDWKASGFIPRAHLVIADTDYRNYVVFHIIIPRNGGGIERFAMNYGRVKFVDSPESRQLSSYLDQVNFEKICLDPREFRLITYSPQGIRDCPNRQRVGRGRRGM